MTLPTCGCLFRLVVGILWRTQQGRLIYRQPAHSNIRGKKDAICAISPTSYKIAEIFASISVISGVSHLFWQGYAPNKVVFFLYPPDQVIYYEISAIISAICYPQPLNVSMNSAGGRTSIPLPLFILLTRVCSHPVAPLPAFPIQCKHVPDRKGCESNWIAKC